MQIDLSDHLHRFRNRIARYRFINWTLSVHTRIDIDVGNALQYLADSGLERVEPAVTLEHLWLCAAARVLRERPLFNSHFDGYMRFQAQDEVNLRVAFEAAEGIAFGVIQHADRLNPQQMALAYQDMQRDPQPAEFVERAPRTLPGRLGRLIDDFIISAIDYMPLLERVIGDRAGFETGSFTVINVGAYGAEDFHAVVLRPAVGVLYVMKPKSLLVPGPDGPRFERRVPMAVPFCHKVMDTDAAGYFLWHMQQKLDDPMKFFDAPQQVTSPADGTAPLARKGRKKQEATP